MRTRSTPRRLTLRLAPLLALAVAALACGEGRRPARPPSPEELRVGMNDTVASFGNELLVLVQLEQAVSPILAREWPRPPRGMPWMLQVTNQPARGELSYIPEVAPPTTTREAAYTVFSQSLRRRLKAPPLVPRWAPFPTPPGPAPREYQLAVGPMLARGDSIFVTTSVTRWRNCPGGGGVSTPGHYHVVFIADPPVGWLFTGRVLTDPSEPTELECPAAAVPAAGRG